MLVAVPSKGRAGKTTTDKVLRSATMFVPESEKADYERGTTAKVVGVPVNGITKTRNWILDNAEDGRVVFIDDDAESQGWAEARGDHFETQALTEEEWRREFRTLFEVTEQAGLRIWGVATTGARRSFYPFQPFRWHSYVTASCMGMVNDGRTRFDETFPVKEDYELCLRCLKEDGAVVAARHLYWENKHWSTEGGCKTYRTTEMEEQAIAKLIRLYPGLIKRVTRGGSEYSIDLDF